MPKTGKLAFLAKLALSVLVPAAVFSAAGAAAYQIRTTALGREHVLTRAFESDGSAVTGVTVAYGANGRTHVQIRDLAFTDARITRAAGNLGHAVELLGDNAKITDAYITFTYNPARLDGAAPEALAVATLDEETGRMTLLEDCILDTEAHTVTAYTTHFSQYVLVDTDTWYNVWLEAQYRIRNADQASGYRVCIVFDRSGSMDGDKFRLCQESVCNFIDAASDYDVIDLYTFASGASLLATYDARPASSSGVLTLDDTDAATVKEKINAAHSGGGTDINSALRAILVSLNGSVDTYETIPELDPFLGRFAVLLTDGQSGVDSALVDKCRDFGIAVITVGLGSDVEENVLRDIAARTGGSYVFAEDANALVREFASLESSLLGIRPDLDTDSDGDGIPDLIETAGMRNQYGEFIRTDPHLSDTDGDGISDRDEMGALVEDDNVSDADRARGLTKYVYFQMASDPTQYDKRREMKDAQMEVELNRLSSEECDIGFQVSVANPCVDRSVNPRYNDGLFSLQDSLRSVTVELSYPSCLDQPSIISSIDWIDVGETVSIPAIYMHHTPVICEKPLTYTFKKLKITEPTRFDVGDCENTHTAVVTVRAANHAPVTKQLNFGFSDTRTYRVDGKLTVSSELTIGENCTLDVRGGMNVTSSGSLVLSPGAVINVHGNFTFDSKTDHKDNLAYGQINVYYGDADIKRNYNSTGEHVLGIHESINSKYSRHTLTVTDSRIENVYIDGGLLDVKIQNTRFGKKKGDIHRITFMSGGLRNEIEYFSDQAKGILDLYLSAMEAKGLDTIERTSPFCITAYLPVDKAVDADVERTIQRALMDYCLGYADEAKTPTSYKDILKACVSYRADVVNGVRIDPYAGLTLTRNTVYGVATYKNRQYTFTLSPEGMDQALSAFMTTVGDYAYSEIKSAVNEAAEQSGKALGGSFGGKFFKVYSEFCFAINDGDWKSFLKSVVKETDITTKTIRVSAEKMPRLKKYIEFCTAANDTIKAASKISKGRKGSMLISDCDLLDSLDGLVELQSALEGYPED